MGIPQRALAVALLAAGVAAACGSKPATFTEAPRSPGGDDGGSSGSSSSGGGSSGGASPDSGIVFPSTSGGSTSSGGGAVGCGATCMAAGGTCANSVCSITEIPGVVATATQTKLQGTGTSDSGFVWLYPYNKTVFPRGLLSPTMQFGGGASDAEYVHITSKTLDYKGYFAGGAAGAVKLSLSQKAWAAVGAAVGPGDTASVKVTKISGISVAGPISETWPIAQGTIRGTVFYETYGSTIAGGRNSVAILKINPGATAPTVFQGSNGACGAICHSASADGSTIVSATSIGPSASWSVKTGSMITSALNTTFTYMGLYPDGTFGMTATSYNSLYGPAATSRLFDTKTGTT